MATTDKPDKEKKAQRDRDFIWASGTFLSNALPTDWETLADCAKCERCGTQPCQEWLEHFVEENMWEPFEYTPPEDVIDLISQLADDMREYAGTDTYARINHLSHPVTHRLINAITGETVKEARLDHGRDSKCDRCKKQIDLDEDGVLAEDLRGVDQCPDSRPPRQRRGWRYRPTAPFGSVLFNDGAVRVCEKCLTETELEAYEEAWEVKEVEGNLEWVKKN